MKDYNEKISKKYEINPVLFNPNIIFESMSKNLSCSKLFCKLAELTVLDIWITMVI